MTATREKHHGPSPLWKLYELWLFSTSYPSLAPLSKALSPALLVSARKEVFYLFGNYSIKNTKKPKLVHKEKLNCCNSGTDNACILFLLHECLTTSCRVA